MRTFLPAFVTATLLLGCCKTDPIDKVVQFASSETVLSYPFTPVDLPQSAAPDQVVSVLTNRGALHKVSIMRVRDVRLPNRPTSFAHYTAVLVDSAEGQKVVLMRPLNQKDAGWYFKIYDSK